MGIEYESVVDHPLAEVFAWHTRPGAMSRLVPPWQPMKVLAETDSLADGRAVLGLPGGLRWVAQHDPAGFDPPHRFVDVLSSEGAGVVAGPGRSAGGGTPTSSARRGRAGPGCTTASTRSVPARGAARRRSSTATASSPTTWPRTATPPRPERSRWSSRHRRVRAGRLRADGIPEHRRAPGDPPGPAPRAQSTDERQWNPDRPAPDLLAGVDAVVHLAGASIAGRFTAAHKAAIRDSRIEPTRRLAEVAAAGDDGPRTFVSASADRLLRFRPRRRAAVRGQPARRRVPRRRRRRLGGRDRPRRRGGAAGRHGADRDRAGRRRRHAAADAPAVRGRAGRAARQRAAVAVLDRPGRPARRLLPRALRRAAHRPGQRRRADAGAQPRLHQGAGAGAAPPGRAARCRRSGPRLLLGEQGARELAEADQRVVPTKLQALGHRFRHARIDDALAHQLGHG